ncbi:MAG: histidine kinase [Spirosomataceae bacterium]
MEKKQKIYWICQIGGWSLWLLNDMLGNILQYERAWWWIGEFVVNILICILLTHQYRRLVKRWNWSTLSYERGILRILVATVIMASLLSLVNLPLDARVISDLSSTFLFTYFLYWAKPMLLWMVFYHIFHHFERTREIEIEKVRLESSIKETESKVLRAQLNPHFMFNALNSIRALILEDPEKAQKGITQLSNILRSSLLADRRKTVSLGEELKTVDDYLALEKIRYEDRLEVRKNIYPETLGIQIPPMMVQTLVENAIKHGVSKPVKGGFVSLEAKVVNHRLDLRISNTGVLGNTDSGGFGLENTAHRLRLLFGEGATFSIFQASKDVVCAEVIIPQPIPETAKVTTKDLDVEV